MLKKKDVRPLKDQIIESALKLSSEEPWECLSLQDIAEHANIEIDDALEYFDDRSDILSAYGRQLDRQMKQAISFDANDELSIREKLFDILMERFDLINQNRDAVLSILNSFKSDPKQMILSAPHLGKSMARALDIADVDTSGLSGAAHVTGLIGVYLYALKAWKDDESTDLSKTMAALDKALDIAEQTANSSFSGSLMSFITNIKNR